MQILKANNRHLQLSLRKPEDYWHWIEQGCYNSEFAAYDKYLNQHHCFVDIGAWVGGHALYAKTITQHVVAVEPDPVAYEILTANVQDVTLCKAISDKREVVTLGSGALGASTTRLNPKAGNGIGAWIDGQQFDVECITLRDLIATLPDPLFIKIDVEGAEERIFRDAELFKERKPVVLVELHPWWWENESQALNDFNKVKAHYTNPHQIFHNTWVLID